MTYPSISTLAIINMSKLIFSEWFELFLFNWTIVSVVVTINWRKPIPIILLKLEPSFVLIVPNPRLTARINILKNEKLESQHLYVYVYPFLNFVINLPRNCMLGTRKYFSSIGKFFVHESCVICVLKLGIKKKVF